MFEEAFGFFDYTYQNGFLIKERSCFVLLVHFPYGYGSLIRWLRNGTEIKQVKRWVIKWN